METVPSPGFGTLLRRYRQAAGLSQEELAERAGLSARTVGDLERGGSHAPRKDTVELLAEALDLGVPERAALAEAAQRLSPASSSRPTSAGTSSPPLVGRRRELALLERHLGGQGPPVLLAGEPGIGKTRLLILSGAATRVISLEGHHRVAWPRRSGSGSASAHRLC
jgi:transcriptional regulator with XRE-family HTH domain